MTKSVRCRLRWHHWKPVHNPEAGRYLACTRCRAECDRASEICIFVD
jgi:hypothetical protein